MKKLKTWQFFFLVMLFLINSLSLIANQSDREKNHKEFMAKLNEGFVNQAGVVIGRIIAEQFFSNKKEKSSKEKTNQLKKLK